MKIICDTREQAPLKFENYEDVDIGVDKLEVGDYSIRGHDLYRDDHSVIIERKKNCQELVHNLVAGWDTFEREMKSVKLYRHKAIVVCGPNNFPYLYERGFTKVSPEFVYCKLSTLFVDYGVPTIFANSREDAEAIIYRIFKQCLYNVQKEN